MALPSVMGNRWNKVPAINIQRSTFDRSHGLKTAFDAGFIVPIFWDLALPGDTMNVKMSCFARLSTPLKPVMDNMFLDTFFFAVPIRLVWANWEKFNGAQDDPGDSISYTIPQMTVPANGPEIGSLSDYFGWPTDITNGYTAASLWHRSYNLIWREWFRDENLQDSPVVDTGDGPDTLTDYVLKRRGKRHDYFTSCLPWPQKGTAQTLPLGTSAPVMGIGKTNTAYATGPANVYETGQTGTTAYAKYQEFDHSSGDKSFYVEEDPNSAGYPGIFADLSSATAATINQLRQAELYQMVMERDARGGTRYIEIVRSHFGVTSDDARHQRPEYLGGGSSAVNIHPVPMTAMASGGTPEGQQGNLAAYGTVSARNHGFVKSFTEHCIVIGLANVRADITYQEGLERMFSYSTRYDFPLPALATLGEQAVLGKEIFLDGSANDDTTFGYIGRFDEARYKPSKITGILRSQAPSGSLESWHLAPELGSLPTLNDTFIQDNPPVDRVIAVNTEPHFIFDAYFNMKHARPLPVYGVPSLGARL